MSAAELGHPFCASNRNQVKQNQVKQLIDQIQGNRPLPVTRSVPLAMAREFKKMYDDQIRILKAQMAAGGGQGLDGLHHPCDRLESGDHPPSRAIG